jgi:hypothetical protein
MNVWSPTLIIGLFFFLPEWMAFGQVKETRQLISEWVETEQIISEEATEWTAERALLGDLIATLKVENEALDENLAKSEAEMANMSRQRADLSERKLRAGDAVKALRRKIEEIEKKGQALLPIFPTPLLDRMGRFSEAIQNPDRSSEFSLRERMENAVAVLQAANLFHHGVNLEKQKFTIDGKTREFQVLYYGLSVGYFVNEASTTAGYGLPGAKGWEWTQNNDLADKIRQAVTIREKRAMAAFIELPLPVKPVSRKEEQE